MKPEWVLVPKEPTSEMLDCIAGDVDGDWEAGKFAQRSSAEIRPNYECETAYGQYKRLLSAAPSPVFSEEDLERLIRIGCNKSDIHLVCSFPGCTCKVVPATVKAVLSALSLGDDNG